ncbi:hypothetical protein HAX54_043771 [Datura stramonium]|uniref:Uncharacterized protein n=1 Tax=Datura stramonium TaxID=4076 RepID=A0ABS8SP34_DATST|nr:hypothetical protein [Datura stramonium]
MSFHSVWNPWEKKARALMDFGDEDYASLGNRSYCLGRTAAAREKPLQRDRYHGRRLTVTDQEERHQICRDNVLGAIACPLQQKYDRCSR